MRRRLIVMVCVLGLVTAACSSGGDEEPTDEGSSAGPLTGTVTLFGYEDNFVPEVIDPFLEANPDLNVQTAVFGSNDEACTAKKMGLLGKIQIFRVANRKAILFGDRLDLLVVDELSMPEAPARQEDP